MLIKKIGVFGGLKLKSCCWLCEDPHSTSVKDISHVLLLPFAMLLAFDDVLFVVGVAGADSGADAVQQCTEFDISGNKGHFCNWGQRASSHFAVIGMWQSAGPKQGTHLCSLLANLSFGLPVDLISTLQKRIDGLSVFFTLPAFFLWWISLWSCHGQVVKNSFQVYIWATLIDG